MTLTFHPAVQNDFNEAIAYYEGIAGDRVADRFEAEVREALAVRALNPRHFPFYGPGRVWRRAKPRSFPYIIVYRMLPESIRVVVIKHVRRKTSFGIRRR